MPNVHAMHAMIPVVYAIFVSSIGLFALGSVGSLLFLLAAAVFAGRRASPSPPRFAPLSLAVIVPAHNEELVLGGTLASLRAQCYPQEYYEVVVVADNCTDTTAALAHSLGVTVLERTQSTQRGKGFALNYAVQILLSSPHPPDGIVIVDADTWVAPDFLAGMSARLQSGEGPQGYAAWQGRYGVLNVGEGWRTRLMAAAFDLVNHVKPMGRDALKLSVGLKGNGMAFTQAVAAEVAWAGESLTEDLDYGLELAQRGIRVGYAPEACVLAQMPVNARQAASQRSRWERGRRQSVRQRALPLLWNGIRQRNWLLVDMAFDLLVPPMAELGVFVLAWFSLVLLGTVLHVLPHPAGWLLAASLTAVGLLVYVLGGLRAAGAPREAYIALLRAPFYAVWKLMLLSRTTSRREGAAGQEWVRTERAPLVSETPPLATLTLPDASPITESSQP